MEYTTYRKIHPINRKEPLDLAVATFWIFGNDDDGEIRKAADTVCGLAPFRQRLGDAMRFRATRYYKQLLRENAVCLWSETRSDIQCDKQAQSVYAGLLELAALTICPQHPEPRKEDFKNFFPDYTNAHYEWKQEGSSLRELIKGKLQLIGKTVIDECLRSSIVLELQCELGSAELSFEHHKLLRTEYDETVGVYASRIMEAYRDKVAVERAKQDALQPVQQAIDRSMDESDDTLEAQRIAGLIGRSRSFRTLFSK